MLEWHGTSVVSFKVDTRMAAGPRVIRSASTTKLSGEFLVDMGKFVVFEDIGGDVLRGVILSLSLYIPPTRRPPKMTKLGGQVVIFALVYITVRLTFCVVVMTAHTRAPSALFCVLFCHPPCSAQTVYLSGNVPVQGFPHATVLDQARLESVQRSWAIKLNNDDDDMRDKKYWEMTVHPARSQARSSGASMNKS